MPSTRTIKTSPHPFSEEVLTRQRLVRVALGQEEADLVLTGATVLNAHTVSWKKDWTIAISGQRIAWTGPSEQWSGRARKVLSVAGLWAVPGFGEAHKHIESTMLSPEYEADLVLALWHHLECRGLSRILQRKQPAERRVLDDREAARKPIQDFSVARVGHSSYRLGGIRRLLRLRGSARSNRPELWVTGLDEVMDWSAVVQPTNPGYQRLWENIQATLDAQRRGGRPWSGFERRGQYLRLRGGRHQFRS